MKIRKLIYKLKGVFLEFHNPYEYILQRLFDKNGNHNELDRRIGLRNSKIDVKKLRESYWNFRYPVTFYQEKERKAYLLSYYPYYIEPIYEILKIIPIDKLDRIFKKPFLRGTFIGGGPAPEILRYGVVLEIKPSQKDLVLSYVIDIEVRQWDKELDFTCLELSKHYWNGVIMPLPIKFDLSSLNKFRDPKIYKAFKGNFFVIQNCLNEFYYDQEIMYKFIKEIIALMMPGSILLIIDVDNANKIGKKIKCMIDSCNFATCLGGNVSDKPEINFPFIDYPSLLEEELFTNESYLWPRRKTEYIYLVIERISNN